MILVPAPRKPPAIPTNSFSRVGQAQRSPTRLCSTTCWWDCTALVPPYFDPPRIVVARGPLRPPRPPWRSCGKRRTIRSRRTAHGVCLLRSFRRAPLCCLVCCCSARCWSDKRKRRPSNRKRPKFDGWSTNSTRRNWPNARRPRRNCSAAGRPSSICCRRPAIGPRPKSASDWAASGRSCNSRPPKTPPSPPPSPSRPTPCRWPTCWRLSSGSRATRSSTAARTPASRPPIPN